MNKLQEIAEQSYVRIFNGDYDKNYEDTVKETIKDACVEYTRSVVPSEHICKYCLQGFDQSHLAEDGDCQCPINNELTGSHTDVGYNDALKEIISRVNQDHQSIWDDSVAKFLKKWDEETKKFLIK